MPIVLCRVDERLIHGQVVVGWGGPLRAEKMVVVDDELAGSDWEQELYRLGVATDVVADFATVADARATLHEWQRGAERVILLLRNVATLVGLAEHGQLRGVEVNLGGIHHAPGRRQVLPYLFLSREEEAELRRLAADGLRINAQDLPNARSVPLDQLIAA